MAILRAFIGIGLIAGTIFLGIKLVPPFFSNYQLEDAIKNDALQGMYSSKSEEEIRQIVIKQARECDIELKPTEVHVIRQGGFGVGSLAIEADYSVPLEVPGYTTTIDFHPSTKDKGVF